MRVAVVGGGILGSVVALFAASRGWEVDLIDARPTVLSASSCANEGKVHLGPIFALGDAATQELMLRGALSFSSLLDDAMGTSINWPELTSDPFEYIVMPSSLLDSAELAKRYSTMNARFQAMSQQLGSRYLNTTIDRLVDPEPREDPVTGSPVFGTTERAVDPIVLCALVLSRLTSTPTIAVQVSRRVLSLEPVPSGVAVAWQDAGGARGTDRYDFVVNCAWEHQLALEHIHGQGDRNFRVKTAIRFPSAERHRTVTLAQGPFGDVVSYRDYTYASWYPVARLTNEFGTAPSARALQLLAKINPGDEENVRAATWRNSLAQRQLSALQQLKLLPQVAEPLELVGGMIVGHGHSDIDQRGSRLHSRSEFGPRVDGRMVTPRNFKLTTAPLAAVRAIEAIDAAIAPTVLA